jgi:predicted RNase H-like nuclease (RuvC/YqgF family)
VGRSYKEQTANEKNVEAAFHGHIKQLEKKLQERETDKQQLDGQIKELKKIRGKIVKEHHWK